MRAFLEDYRVYGNIGHACEAAKMSRTPYHNWRDWSQDEENPDPEYCLELEDGTLLSFDVACALAEEEAADRLETEARRRASEGTTEPVFGSLGKNEGTGIVGYRQVYSDNLLMFMLKGLRPTKFRDNAKMEVDVKGSIQVESARDRLASKLLAAIEAREQGLPLPPAPEPQALLPDVIDGSVVDEITEQNTVKVK